MYELTVIIPARSEMFLGRTIQDLLEHKEGNTEIIAVLDGKWAEPPIPDHPDLTLIHHPVSIGQRAAANEAARLSNAKYIMKVDAHCAFDQGFDVKMMRLMEDDITMVPVLRNLHAFDWVCPEGHRRYQGPSGPCVECGKPTIIDVVWIAKRNPQSVAYRFDTDLHFQYWNDLGKRQKGDLTETMSIQGSCFMVTRRKYFELDLCSEEFHSWGQQGTQISCTTWLSGGRVLVNRTTWYAHLFRTAGGDFGFPYENPMSKVMENRKLSKELFLNNKWPKQKLPSYWLLEKFWPVPGWEQKDLDDLKLVGRNFVEFSIPNSMPESVTNLTMPVSAIDVGREKMPPLAVGHSGLFGTGANATQDISSMSGESKVAGIETSSVTTNMVNNRNVLTKVARNGTVQPSIDNPMNTNFGSIEPNPSISVVVGISIPNPTPSIAVDCGPRKKSGDKLRVKGIDNKHSPHIVPHLGSVERADI